MTNKLVLSVVLLSLSASCAVDVGPVTDDDFAVAARVADPAPGEVPCDWEDGCTGGGGGGPTGGSCSTCTSSFDCYTFCNLPGGPGGWACVDSTSLSPGFCQWR